MEWNFESDRPIYAQLVEQMERALATGVYTPGEKLPGVRELAADAGVNPNTMQRALAELENKGLVHSQRTSGRFVTQDAGAVTALRTQLATGITRDYIAGMRQLGCADEEITRYVQQVAAQPAAAPAPPKKEE